jgi:hypothetical protein
MDDLMRRFTAIGRPLDPEWASNRAVMVLIPVGGIAAWAWSAFGDGAAAPLAAGVSGALAVLLGWALAREVAPDRHGAAFVSLAFTWLVVVVEPRASLLQAALALVLARIVNRSTGLPPTPLDTVTAVGLAAWAVVASGNPFLGVAAHLAFVADAALPKGLKRHALAAPLVLAVGLAVALGFVPDAPVNRAAWGLPDLDALLPVAALTVFFVRAIVLTGEVGSVGDDTGEPLDRRRVVAAMWVTLGLALSGLPLGEAGVVSTAATWAAMAGVALGVRRG